MSNPIIQRELISILRTWKAVAMQVVPAVAFALVVILRWPADSQVGLTGEQSQAVFRVFAYGLLGAILLLVPAFPATSVVREKISGTLPLLLNSPMSCWSIYFGKLAGALAFVFLPLVMSLPAAAACFAMGGISWAGQVVPLYAILAAAALQYAALGLLVSAHGSSIDGALRLAYAWVLLLAGLTLLPYQFLQAGAYGPQSDWLRCVSPVAAVMEILGHGDVGSQGLVSGGHTVWRFLVLSLALTALFMLRAATLLKQTMFDRPRPQGVITDDRPLLERLFRRAAFVVDPQRRKRPIGPLVNPVMVKEFRSRRFGRSHWLLRLVAACALVSLGLAYATTIGTLSWGVETIGGLMVVLQGALVVLVAPSLAAGLVSAEREAGTWPLLTMTPLSAGRIVRGKLTSALWPLLLILLATLPGYAVMIWIKPVLTQQICYVLCSLGLAAVLSLAVSAAVSSLFRRTAPAMVAAYGVLAALYGGTLLIWLGRDAPFGRSTVETALALNPMAAAMTVLEVPGFEHYRLLPAAWWITGAMIVACLIVLRVRTWQLVRPQ